MMKHPAPHGRLMRSAPMLLPLIFVGATASTGCSNEVKASSGDDKGKAAVPVAPGSAEPRGIPGNAVRRDAFGCLLAPPTQSNSSFEVDCPKNLLRPGEAPPISRRPAGKESWVRVRPWLYFEAGKNECTYKPEWFCSPPGAYAQCSATPASVSV